MSAQAVSTTPIPAPVTGAVLRRTMVDCQLRTFDITDAAVLSAFETVPRENFVGADNAALAYSDAALKVKAGSTERTLLAPMILARLLAAADLKPSDRALDIGGGLGYSAAVLGELVASVTTLESDSEMTGQARSALTGAGSQNVSAVTGPLEAGCPQSRPYDFILVNGAVETNYSPLFDQLAPGGRLIAILREGAATGRAAKAVRFDKLQNGVVGEKWLFDAAATVLAPFRRAPAFVF